MIVEVSHALDIDIAFLKLRKGLDQLLSRNAANVTGVNAIWSKHSGQVSCMIRGVKLNATVRVLPNKIVIAGKLPMVFLLFRNQIAESIKQNVEKILC